MAYTSFQNCTKQEYEEVIYSQDAHNKIKILFNNVELEDADLYCEKLTVKSRIIPNGAKVFSLNNFISQELELILHDIDTAIIQDQIEISIGTLVNNTYEYVPIGIFNIQDTPTNDKRKTTIKLRDNATKFDFNYNAQPLIEENGGSATKLQILQDICTQANVTCNINSFIGSTDQIGIYDNTITARQYIAYLAEQAGKIATINRSGELIFVDLNNLAIWDIPLSVVEKYELGKVYKIGQVIYEDAIRRFETPSSNYDILYIDASNPYISSQEQIESILEELDNFETDSVKTGKILGNPAIDSYDLINIYDDSQEGNPSVFKTLATSDLVYNGVLINTFDTQIGEEEREQNVTLTGEATFKKWARTSIDNIAGNVEIQTGQIEELTREENNNYQELLSKFQAVDESVATIDEIGNIVSQLQTNTYTKTEIQQIANGIGVDGVKVSAVISTSGTFDENGMTYEKTGAKTKSTINEVGVNVKDSNDNSLLFAGYVDNNNTDYTSYKGQTIVGTDNIVVKNYLNVGSHSRIQDYEDGTGIFYM